MRKLLLHIGCSKGGSTAIQRTLRINREELASRGIVVPSHDLRPGSDVTGSHGEFFQSHVQKGKALDMPDLADLLDAQADACDASVIVISAENLSNAFGFEKIFKKIEDRFDLSILMYVRRQDDYLESAWQQWYVKTGRSFLSWMMESIRVQGNWHAALEPWAEAFGDERIIARVYDRQKLEKGDVFFDFCNVIGEDPDSLIRPGEMNRSFTPMLTRFVEGKSFLFNGPHDQSFYDSMRRLNSDLVFKEMDEPGLLSSEEAETVMRVYANANERFRKRYLPHLDQPLFPSKPRKRERARLDRSAFEQGLMQLQIFSLHKELDELRESLRKLSHSD